MSARIRALREQFGWSQAELATRAEVTRQLVGAVEAGRQVPNVAAALRIAFALGTSVEDLFADSPDDGVATLDLLDGRLSRHDGPVRAARVGGHLVSVAVRDGGDHTESWGLADAVRTGSTLRWLPGGRPADLLLAGCDPLLGLLTALVGRTGTHRALAAHASTARSIAALTDGRVHGVVVHARPGDLPPPPVPVRRFKVASWQVGIAAPTRLGDADRVVSELAERRPIVVQREEGAGTQQALARALRAVGAEVELPGPLGEGHLDVARRLAHGVGEAGVLMEAAAHAYGLAFTALERHDVELWLAEPWTASPAAIRLVDQLDGAALRERSRLLAGYDLDGAGTELAG